MSYKKDHCSTLYHTRTSTISQREKETKAATLLLRANSIAMNLASVTVVACVLLLGTAIKTVSSRFVYTANNEESVEEQTNVPSRTPNLNRAVENAGILVADLTTMQAKIQRNLLFAQDYEPPPQPTVAFLQQVKAVAEALYDDLLMEQANMVQTNSRRVQTQEFPLTQQENNMADQQRSGYYRTEEMNREMAELEQENAEEQQRPLEAAKEGYGRYGGYAGHRYGYGRHGGYAGHRYGYGK